MNIQGRGFRLKPFVVAFIRKLFKDIKYVFLFLINIIILLNYLYFHVDLTYFSLSSKFFILAANQGTSCVTGIIVGNQHPKPTQYYILSIANSSALVAVLNNVTLSISDDIGKIS